MLPADYAPPDLTAVTSAGFGTESRAQSVRAILIADLSALRADAGAAGYRLSVLSGYRSYAVQQATFSYWVSVGGYDQALHTSARAGHSEHQLGTVIDFSSVGQPAPWEYADWGATGPGRWLAQNAWRYGFVMSYPAGKTAVTCYDYEPWHFRWVGRDRAAAVRQSGLTLREFLGT
jgi:D-alanyl-D-alanine carboxypeptidase